MVRQVLVIIGAGGMGAAIGRRLGSGRQIVLADRDHDVLRDVVDSMTDEGLSLDPPMNCLCRWVSI